MMHDCEPSAREVISVLIAHGSAMSGQLLAAALEGQSRFRVIARVSSLLDVVEIARTTDVDVALIAANLQDGNLSGFDALRQLRECRPEIRAVILLDKDDEHSVITAFRLGAKGIFCPIQSDFTMLCRCVERVHEGQIWANSRQMGYAVEALTQLAPLPTVEPGRLKLLTKRERDVARLLAEGFTNRDMARELKLSEHTIKNYLFHMFDKLGVSNRVELVLWAVSGAKVLQIDTAEGQIKDSQVSNGSPLSMSAVVGKQ